MTDIKNELLKNAKIDCGDMYADDYKGHVCYRAAKYILALERQEKNLQVKIDALMLEYCPCEMTEEQKTKWGKAQKPINTEKLKKLITEESQHSIDCGERKIEDMPCNHNGEIEK